MFNTEQPNYRSLRALLAERTDQIVFWAGAGLSVSAKLPTWSELKTIVIDHFRSHCASLEESDRSRMLLDIDNIAKESDLWLVFQRLHALAKTTYVEAIKKAFARADTCQVPATYRRLFDIQAKGLITLNIDRLASRAFSLQRPGTKLLEFGGNQCDEYFHVLQGPNSFIMNAHGVVDSVGSWVFRKDQLKWLFEQVSYKSFIQSVLTNNTVVFIGISADDVAVEMHLHRLAENGIRVRGHYWITDRRDQRTDRWAEEEGILLIRYSPDNEHQALGEMLDDIVKYRPSEPSGSAPIMPTLVSDELHELPSPIDLLGDAEENIRNKLNAYARFILRDNNPTRYRDYEKFRAMYDKCIHHCWYVDTQPPHNMLMGYELKREIAEGSFGRVFEAVSQSGNRVAVKLLREEVRRKPDMLQSFRRGVRAMRILSDHGVKGMVGYSECSEIPAFAVMEFIDGPNLKEAVQSGYLDDWDNLLRYAIELSTVIRRAHQLPERVLHRDVRPANIMLQDYFVDPSESHIVVLDFDLSWHRDAQEVSITQGPAMHGYLAPELTDRNLKVSTRSAAVDSFGLGMTMFFMRTKTEPMYMQHRHATWEKDVRQLIASYSSTRWASLPIRFADLVLKCTRDSQANRCDVSQILGELQRLYAAQIAPTEVRAADLLCHELAWRTLHGEGWSYDRQEASVTMPSGLSITLTSDDANHCVLGSLAWDNTGQTEFRRVKKYLGAHADAALSVLKGGGFEITDQPSHSLAGTRIGFKCHCGLLANDMAAKSASVCNALDRLRMD